MVRNGWVVLLIGLVLGWAGARWGMTLEPRLQANVAGAGSMGDLIAFTSDAANGTQLLYLVDPKQKTFSIYELDTRKSKLKLAVVRHYAADHQLAEFNNEPPQVGEIEKLVRQGERTQP